MLVTGLRRIRPILFGVIVLSSAANTIRVPMQAPTIQAALDAISNGDTVLIAIGVYAEALQAPPLHFVMKGDVVADTGEYARPIIDPSPLPGSDSLGCLSLPFGSWPVLEDLMFRNGPEMYPHWEQSVGGIRCQSFDVTIRRCVFDSTFRTLQFVPPGPNLQIIDSLIDCTFRDLQFVGISQLDYAVVAIGCSFESGNAYSLCVASHGSRINSCYFGTNIAGSSLTVLGNDCQVTDCQFGLTVSPNVSMLIIGQDTTGVIVRHNVFSGGLMSGAALIAEAYAPQAFLIEDNLFTDIRATADSATCVRAGPYFPFFVAYGGTIRNNVFLNCFGQTTGANVGESNGTNIWFQNRFVETIPDPDNLPSLYLSQGDSTVLRNNAFLHTGFALASTAATIDAELNYWGAPTGPYHDTENPGGHGDTIVGNVDFTPWYPDTSFLDEARRIHAPLPDHFTLDAYPNPFNSSVTLKLIPNEVMIINVELFDILGRRVKELWSGPIAYEKQITFDGSDLASGIYFVRVWQPIGNRPLALQKIVLLK